MIQYYLLQSKLVQHYSILAENRLKKKRPGEIRSNHSLLAAFILCKMICKTPKNVQWLPKCKYINKQQQLPTCSSPLTSFRSVMFSLTSNQKGEITIAAQGVRQTLRLTCLAAKFHPVTIHCAMATAPPLVPGAFSSDQ